MQKLGSAVVNKAAGTRLPDAASGFRAYSRDSLIRLNTITRFSYCTETIIQAGNKGLHIESVEIDTNPKLRESRLFNSTWEHVLKSGVTIVRAYVMYKPYMIFGVLGWLLFLIGLVPFLRFIVLSLSRRRLHRPHPVVADRLAVHDRRLPVPGAEHHRQTLYASTAYSPKTIWNSQSACASSNSFK